MLQCTHKCYYSRKFGGKLSSHMLFGIHWHYVLLPLSRWQRNHIICYKYLYDHDNITVIWCTICTAHMFVTHHWPRLNHLNTRPREHNKSDWISLNRNSTKANYLVNAPKIIIFNDFMVHLFVQLPYLLFGLVTFRFTKKHTHTNIYMYSGGSLLFRHNSWHLHKFSSDSSIVMNQLVRMHRVNISLHTIFAFCIDCSIMFSFTSLKNIVRFY